MKKSKPPLLEVTQALADCAKAAGFEFGADTALVAVQHMLWQTLDLFQAAGELNLRPGNIFVLGKVYSNNDFVIRTLRDRGITVVNTTAPELGQFDQYFHQDVEQLWRVAAAALAQRPLIKRILVLDDGGACINRTPPDLLRRYAICGVEQTSLGIFRFELKPPPFAAMSWARSAPKLKIGGTIFSQCLLEKLQNRFLNGKLLSDETIGVIGLGSIGSGLANLAARQGNRVFFYDPHPELKIPRDLSDRVTRLDSLEELMLRCDYVFGCSGRNPFANKWPMKHRNGIKLFSASGGDHEFGPIINELKTRPGFEITPGDWNIHSDSGPSGDICVAYLGYPYNFVAREVEAVPTRIVQLETGGLLAALIQARNYLELTEKDQLLNKGLHRVSPDAQRFVYEAWLAVMEDRGIDLYEIFGGEPDWLAEAQSDCWFEDHSEPQPSFTYQPNSAIEREMAHLVNSALRSQFIAQRHSAADFRPF